ncbi:conserved exported hypothetical protein [Hyphomicrobiales bacterium]|nr:conserved exported hypothetical protein [Hyphomicrobiales bacterium]CAH1664378.1 conserved exported hypothetical protein [Hyphomicrobiales bacterium]
MRSILNGLCAIGLVAASLGAGTASAQTAADQMAVAYQAARNQLGVLTYCQSKGFADEEALAIQKKLLGLIPAPADTTGGDSAEELGKKGTISAMGRTQDLEAGAKTQGSSVEALCQAMVKAIKQVASQLPK